MAPSGIKIGKEQLNVLAYADGIVLIGKNETEIRQLFVETENIARKVGLHINQGKTKYIIVERKKSSKQNKIGQLTIQNYTFQRAENFKHLSVILNEEDNNHLIDFPERVKNSNEMYFMFIYFCTILCNNLLINFCSPFYFHLYCIMFIVQC